MSAKATAEIVAMFATKNTVTTHSGRLFVDRGWASAARTTIPANAASHAIPVRIPPKTRPANGARTDQSTTPLEGWKPPSATCTRKGRKRMISDWPATAHWSWRVREKAPRFASASGVYSSGTMAAAGSWYARYTPDQTGSGATTAREKRTRSRFCLRSSGESARFRSDREDPVDDAGCSRHSEV